ncbi:MAG: hypothetical protein H6534_10060 [Chthonomonadaceae bacterium]|nr:hypothetical protein [Chthonomonadaceae bacterium]
MNVDYHCTASEWHIALETEGVEVEFLKLALGVSVLGGRSSNAEPAHLRVDEGQG